MFFLYVSTFIRIHDTALSGVEFPPFSGKAQSSILTLFFLFEALVSTILLPVLLP
jgi:hypothetical protein